MKTLRHRNQLHMAQAQIENMVKQIEDQRIGVEIERLQLQDAKKELKNIIKINNRILKNNELFIFTIKESTVSTVKDYEQLASVLRSVLSQEYDPDNIRGFLIGVENKIAILQDYFANTFSTTTDQYIDQSKRVKKLN